jgi:hypothetical protein
MDDQLPLFESKPTGPPRPAAKAPKPDRKAIYSRYRSTNRVLCIDCCRLIHEYGQQGAPVPLRAQWRTVVNATAEYVCHEHKRTRRGEER